MKKLLAVFVAVMLLCTFVSAQDMVKEGSKSLNFTFGGLGTFGLNGTGPSGGLGISYFLSSDAAVRLGLQVSSVTTSIPANPGANQNGTDGSTSNLTLGIGLDYLMFMNTTGRVRPYGGAGVSFTTISTSQKPAVIAPAVQNETKGIGAGTSLGVVGICGAEFFIYPEISLSAEYQLNLINLNMPADITTGTTTTKQTSTTRILGFGAGGAAIHIYF